MEKTSIFPPLSLRSDIGILILIVAMGNVLSSELPDDWATVDMVAQHAYCPAAIISCMLRAAGRTISTR